MLPVRDFLDADFLSVGLYESSVCIRLTCKKRQLQKLSQEEEILWK